MLRSRIRQRSARPSFARLAAVAVALCALAAVPLRAARAQDIDPDKVEIRTEKLADGVYLLRGAGGNIGLATGADGTFLIDDEYAPLTPKVVAAVRAIRDEPVKFVINTHWHNDHTGGNKDLGEAGALIVAHENVRKRMSTDQFIAAFGKKVPAAPPKALPLITFTESVTFHLNGDDVDVVHVPPAHTDGDSIVLFRKANVVHAGDVFFNGLYPFIDVSSGGSVDGMVGASDKLLALVDDHTKVIPGHGPLSDRAGLKAYRDMLATVRDRVKAMIADGKSLPDIQAARPSKEFDDTWGKGFLTPDQFVALVHSSLTAPR